MTASRGIRATRSDVGKVAITDRDVAVITFVADQYAVPMRLFQELLGRYGERSVGRRAATKRAGRLVVAGVLRADRLLGETWLSATTKGLAYADRGYVRNTPPAPIQLQHVGAMSRLRLALTDAHPGTTWESERAIRRRWAGSGARVRIADGGLHFPDGLILGVELELTPKQQWRYQSIVADQDPQWQQLWWFVRSESTALWLQGVLSDVGAGPEHSVRALTGELAGVLQ